MIQTALGGEEESGVPRGRGGKENMPHLQKATSGLAGSHVQGYAGRRESFPDPCDFLPALGMDLAGT